MSAARNSRTNHKKPPAVCRGTAAGASPWRTQAGIGHAGADDTAAGPNQRWSLDFVSNTRTDGRRFRLLVVVDDFTRECLSLVADASLSGARSRMCQHVPAATRHLRHMRRTAIALGILGGM